MTALRGRVFARLCLSPSREELEAALRETVSALDRARILLARLDGAGDAAQADAGQLVGERLREKCRGISEAEQVDAGTRAAARMRRGGAA